jgi:uncharacterized protein YggE
MAQEESRLSLTRSRIPALALGAALCLAGATNAAAQDAATPSITVTGSGRVQATPDLANVSAGVVTEAARAADAVRANTDAMQKVIAALDAAGIERRFVQTSRFDVSSVYADSVSARPGRMPAITGYRAANQVRVEVRGVDRVGGVIDALVAAGANELGGVSFGIAEPAPLLDEARKRAIADARRRAELFAKEAGVALGRVVRIDETGGAPGPGPVAYRMEAASAPPIAPGEVDLEANVSVTWSLAP